jgi:HSP20 family protein
MVRVYVERRELPDDLRRLLDPNIAAAECTPPIDVCETPDGVEILLDVPGVPASEIDIVFAQNVVLIAGRKQPPVCDHADAGFHVAERAFGRFGRAVKLDAAVDAGAATATLRNGVLRLVLPRLDERRGRQIRIPIQP